MPEMDGLTAIREIRRRPWADKLPIIALTAKAMQDDQEKCLAAGANDYIAKPLDVDKLLSLVRVWMPQMKASPVSDQASDIELPLLLDAIYLRYHYDFRGYATASLKRRLQRRARAFRLPHVVAAPGSRCCTTRRTFPVLLDYLTVPVSDMFRDPVLLSRLARAGRAGPADLSVAEDLGRRLQHGRRGVFVRHPAAGGGPADADVDLRHRHQSAHAAGGRGGRLRLDRLALFSDNHRKSGGRTSLSDYYTAAYGRAVFDKSLKRHIVFSDHSLATDNVFAEVHVVSCRNVLIYFNRDLQDRAIGLFRDALVPQRIPRPRRQGVVAVLAPTPTPSSSSIARTGCFRSGRRSDEADRAARRARRCGRHRHVRGRRRGAVRPAAGAAGDHARRGAGRASHPARAAEPAGRHLSAASAR